MDETLFTETVERLKAVDAVIKDLDPALRTEAVVILRPYVMGQVEPIEDDDAGGDAGDDSPEAPKTPRLRQVALDLDALVEEHHSDKEASNARLALAIYYARHGRGPLKPNRDLKAIGEEAGLILPDRIDMSLKGVKHESNPVLRKMGDGYRITPAGERMLKETYAVSKGREVAPAA